MTGPEHIALIGCGFAGTSALFQLVDRYPVKRITVFEASGVFGPGYPYNPDECPDYLINNTTDTMCLVPENRQAFINWLRSTGVAEDVDAKGHLPRALYGRFLEDVVRTARTVAAIKGIALDLIPAEATGLQETGEGVEITWPDGVVRADVAILTTGRCPDLFRFGEAGGGFFTNHVMEPDLDSIPADAAVAVLGTSLSAYDIVNRLFAPDTGCRFERGIDGTLAYSPGPNTRRVTLHSRNGRLKKMQSQKLMALSRRHFAIDAFRARAAEKGGLTLEDMAQMIRAEAAAHGASIDWDEAAAPYSDCTDAVALNAKAGAILTRDIAAARKGGAANFLVDMFAHAQLDIWDGFAERLLRAEEEQRYRRKYETAVLTYSAPCPVPTGERLLALHKAGALTVRAGAAGFRREGKGFLLTHRFGEDRADVLIDASGGVNRRVEGPGQPALIRDMVAGGLMKGYFAAGEDASLGADIDMKTLRIVGTKNVYTASMLLWGPGFFTSSAYMMAALLDRILKGLYGRPKNLARPN